MAAIVSGLLYKICQPLLAHVMAKRNIKFHKNLRFARMLRSESRSDLDSLLAALYAIGN
jgi:hypothetical protein